MAKPRVPNKVIDSMMRVEKELIGEVAVSPGCSFGFLEQEPHHDVSKTVLEIVKERTSEASGLLAEFEAFSDEFSRPMEPDARPAGAAASAGAARHTPPPSTL